MMSTISTMLTWLILNAHAGGVNSYNYTTAQNYLEEVSYVYGTAPTFEDVTFYRPLLDQTDTLNVNLTMRIYSLNGFDDVTGQIEIAGSLEMTWTDEVLDGVLFEDNTNIKDSIVLPYSNIWTPTIVLVNDVNSIEKIGSSDYRPRYTFSTNRVEWKVRVILKGSCEPDVTYYPFDQQTCSYIFTSWYYNNTQISLMMSKDTWDTSLYENNSVWSLEETKAETFTSNGYEYANFTIVIQRQYLYFVFNIVLPILLLSATNGFVFLLPVESGERVGFSIMCFLSIVVLLQTTMQFLPESSIQMSLLCYYLVLMMVSSAILVIVNILMMRVYLKSSDNKVPKVLQTFVSILTCTICKKCSKKVSAQDEDKSIDGDEDVTETEVKWPAVAKVLDIFLFLAFLGGQAALTFFFLLPLGLRA
ncbi:hypothetical protein CHS0354_017866 [Potamilus streckersoni]|uniref:Uncharacterized protein n=1 Tax=Potamilus streckersoni TaxID=2493646 RepID=A0AAE0TJD4_9BIVA|nr:hypothetical protein CHS0354_017866 [Potamilus streckersoni]